jgi:hypothetical protein
MRVRRTAGVVAVTLWAAAGVAGPAAAETVISTLADENGTFPEFGCPDTGAYGQTVTVPAGESSLESFSFRMNLPAGVVFRGVVMAWDGDSASGPVLFESGPRSTAGSGMETVTFTTGGVPVVEGQVYVLFAQADCILTPNNTVGFWGSVNPPGAYDDGSIAFQNNGGDFSQVTGVWDFVVIEEDFAFEAVFGLPAPEPPAPPPAPEAAPIALELVPTFTG